MNKILIASADMEVGGVERSLISMLHNFDYTHHQIDLMLYSHTGDLMGLLPYQVNVLAEITSYRTFRMSIAQVFKAGKLPIGLARLIAKYQASMGDSTENGYKQLQYMWKYALPFLPKLEEPYDVAISYLWPHDFVAGKVRAKTKIAWVHTDYSTVDTDVERDVKIWDTFTYIFAVSDECKNAFVRKYPELTPKVIVMENITAPDVVKRLADEPIDNPLTQDNRFKVMTVARLSYAKGIDLAVKALKILKDQGYDDISWYVVGYGGDEEEIQMLISKYGLEQDVILLGKQINPYPFMKAADLYVQPSRYEGKAVTVGEAQILGKPVLITNYPTAKSQVTQGVDGSICDLSVEGIAQGIERLLNNPTLRTKLANNCKETNYHNKEELGKLYELL